MSAAPRARPPPRRLFLLARQRGLLRFDLLPARASSLAQQVVPRPDHVVHHAVRPDEVVEAGGAQQHVEVGQLAGLCTATRRPVRRPACSRASRILGRLELHARRAQLGAQAVESHAGPGELVFDGRDLLVGRGELALQGAEAGVERLHLRAPASDLRSSAAAIRARISSSCSRVRASSSCASPAVSPWATAGRSRRRARRIDRRDDEGDGVWPWLSYDLSSARRSIPVATAATVRCGGTTQGDTPPPRRGRRPGGRACGRSRAAMSRPATTAGRM